MGKKTCKVFTPPDMVVYMLDKIGYTDDLLGKKVLENSCGTGHFLQEIVRRYIRDGRTRQVTDEDQAWKQISMATRKIRKFMSNVWQIWIKLPPNWGYTMLRGT